MKKVIVAALCAFALILSPMGNAVFQDVSTTVDAKRYKSGKKTFNQNNNSNNSFFQQKKKDNESTNQNKATTKQNQDKKGGFTSGGLMKGLMLGGVAGLIFGGLLGNMGILGSLLGLMINGIVIIGIIAIGVKIYQFVKRKKKEEANVWRN